METAWSPAFPPAGVRYLQDVPDMKVTLPLNTPYCRDRLYLCAPRRHSVRPARRPCCVDSPCPRRESMFISLEPRQVATGNRIQNICIGCLPRYTTTSSCGASSSSFIPCLIRFPGFGNQSPSAGVLLHFLHTHASECLPLPALLVNQTQDQRTSTVGGPHIIYHLGPRTPGPGS